MTTPRRGPAARAAPTSPDTGGRGRDLDRVRIFLCGDVMTGRGLDQVLPQPAEPELRERFVRSALTYVTLAERAHGPIRRPVRPEDIWGDALETWRAMAPDVRLANLETTITRSDDFAPKGINYRMAPANAACLAAAGLDACSLANNHILDFGPAGLVETLEVLQQLGIRPVGAGRDQAQAGAPVTVQLPGQTRRVIVAAAAFEDSGTPPHWRAGARALGVNLLELSQGSAGALAARIAAVRAPGDIGVASLHWGSNWGYQVPESHRSFAHALIDSGQVSIVHGHSSHHPRPVEVYRGRLILYGCGDFLNDYEGISGYEEFRSELVAMYFADLDREGDLRRLELVPLSIRGLRLNRAAPHDAAWLRDTLNRESARFGVSLNLEPPGHLVARFDSGPRSSPAEGVHTSD